MFKRKNNLISVLTLVFFLSTNAFAYQDTLRKPITSTFTDGAFAQQLQSVLGEKGESNQRVLLTLISAGILGLIEKGVSAEKLPSSTREMLQDAFIRKLSGEVKVSISGAQLVVTQAVTGEKVVADIKHNRKISRSLEFTLGKDAYLASNTGIEIAMVSTLEGGARGAIRRDPNNRLPGGLPVMPIEHFNLIPVGYDTEADSLKAVQAVYERFQQIMSGAPLDTIDSPALVLKRLIQAINETPEGAGVFISIDVNADNLRAADGTYYLGADARQFGTEQKDGFIRHQLLAEYYQLLATDFSRLIGIERAFANGHDEAWDGARSMASLEEINLGRDSRFSSLSAADLPDSIARAASGAPAHFYGADFLGNYKTGVETRVVRNTIARLIKDKSLATKGKAQASSYAADSWRASLKYEPKHTGMGTSGFRGRVDDMRDAEPYAIASGFVKWLIKRGQLKGKLSDKDELIEIAPGQKMVLTGDFRDSSPDFMAAVLKAYEALGIETVFLGNMATPNMAYYCQIHKIPGIMITGSHTEGLYNGLKLYDNDGEVLNEADPKDGDVKSDREEIMAQVDVERQLLYNQKASNSIFDENGVFKRTVNVPDARKLMRDAGVSKNNETARGAYVDRYLTGMFKGHKPFNGHAIVYWEHSTVARSEHVAVLQGLGAEVIKVGRRDDAFIALDTENMTKDHLAYLREQVELVRETCEAKELSDGRVEINVSKKAYEGLKKAGFDVNESIIGKTLILLGESSSDGDGDRSVAVDEKGRFWRGDVTGAIVGETLKGGYFVQSLTGNQDVRDYLENLGVKFVDSSVGSPYHVYLIRELLRLYPDANILGQEVNGGTFIGSRIIIPVRLPNGEEFSVEIDPLNTRDATTPMLLVFLRSIIDQKPVSALFEGHLDHYADNAGLIHEMPVIPGNKRTGVLMHQRYTPEGRFGLNIKQVTFNDNKKTMMVTYRGAGVEPVEVLYKDKEIGEKLLLLRNELQGFFNAERKFGNITQMAYGNLIDDGFVMWDTNGDRFHVRRSGNAPETRIYVYTSTNNRTLEQARDRAREIVKIATEPGGILREIEASVWSVKDVMGWLEKTSATLASNSGLVFASLAEQGHTLSKDFITPLMLQSGQLESQIKAGIVRDTTTNPTSNAGVWDLMVNKNKEWLPLIEEMVRQGMTTQQIYDNLFIEHLVVPTMQLFDTYKVGEGSGYLHGYVSYEFRPHFTSDPDLTSEKDTVEFERQVGVALDELIRLDTLITEKSGGLHNFFIKVPATHVGIEAGKRAIARHGININWTLIATLDQYKEVAAAYKQARMTSIFTKQGPYGVSVASDFVSRTDREIDPLLEETAPEYKMQSGLAYAIGNIYRHFEREFLQNQDWIDFAGRRNIPIQQIYWGSTGVKVKGEYTANPHYAGPLRLNGTVNTAPPNVVDIMAEDAPFDGNVETPYYTAHEEVLSKLISLSIDINAIQEKVYREGLVGFAKDDKKTFDEIDGFIRQIRDKETLASNSDLKLIDTFKANPSLLKINCQVQHYEWGNRDFIPALLGVDNSGGKPYAELWIGAHPKAPAQANIGNSVISLDKLISGAAEEILGQGGIGNQLPYLLKVLSAGDMLSIQAHPDKNQAAEGYRKENEAGIPIGASNRNYKDSNHKPELIVALTDFYALNGFRPLAEIAETLENTEEFRMLMPSVFMTRLKAVNLTQEGRRELLRELYVKIMTMGQDEVDVILNPLISRLKTGSFDKDQREYWVLKADKQYTSDGHADRGIFSIYLLNLVHLNPSDGMYLDAGELHAYLQGTGMECMANSDNVLRGGLTPKYVDAPELINVLTFNDGKPQILTSENAFFDAESVYRTPSKEFVVSFITARNGQNYKSPRAHSADTFLVLDGEVEIRAGQQSLRLAKGDTVMIPAVLGEYEITGEGKLCKATVPAATLGSNQILAHAQQSFVDFVSGQRVAGVRFNPDGGMRSEHGESYLDVGSPDYFFRGANAFNYPAVKNVIIGSLIHDRSEFAAREGEVFYIMNHGFIATPANLRALVDNGITDGRIHDTFFPQRSPYFPGSEQYQQTGGHYQGNSVDVKFVTEGKGLQILIWMGKDRKLHTLTQEMSPGKWVYALPGTSDVVVNLGGLRFNDISFKVGAATENRIREDMGISVNFNEASLKSLARAGCVFVCEKADNDKGYVIMPYFDGFVRGAVDFVDTAPNITPVLDGSQVGMDLIELYKNRPEILLGFYDKGFAEGLSGFFKGERSLASNNMVDLVNYAKRFVPEAVDVIADIESVEERLRSMRGRFLIRNADTGKDMPSGDLLEIALNATDKIVLLIQLENGAYKTLILNKADNIPADTGLASNLGIQRRELKAMQSGN